MNPRTRKKIALLARRLLGAQLELFPKSKTSIRFYCSGLRINVRFDDRRWQCLVTPLADNADMALEIPF